MHPESKAGGQGRQVGRTPSAEILQGQILSQQDRPRPPGNPGSKAGRGGSHGVKASPMSSGNPGMKSVGQSVGGKSGGGGMAKSKAKRERSVSADAGDQKDAVASAVQSELKEGAVRSKRRCVLEKKQPYSGDEWCSGGGSDEEEEKPPNTAHGEHMMSCPAQSVPAPEQRGPGADSADGPGARSDQLSESAQQVVYVFTTNLANSAAEAVMHGRTDSILLFHQQNVPRTKLEKCTAVEKLSSLSEQLSSTPPVGTPKSQSETPRPASVGGVIVGQSAERGTPCSTGQPVVKAEGIASHGGGVTSQPLGPGEVGVHREGLVNHPSAGISPSVSPSVLCARLQGDGGPRSVNGLSKEQLEHRERSLQTLRDIEKLLLRSGAGAGHEELGTPNTHPTNGANKNPSAGFQQHGNLENSGGNPGDGALSPSVHPLHGLKKHESLQSIMSQAQNHNMPCMDDALMAQHQGLHPDHNLSSPSGMDMAMVLGSDGLTPEQIAWRKLQVEYYHEKRRRQEMNPHPDSQHFRMMPEMGRPEGPHLMMRAPPPPYQSRTGNQWGPRPSIAGGMEGNLRLIDVHQEGPRGPRFLGQMHRGPPAGSYPGSPGNILPVEGPGPQRSPRAGMGWLDNMPPNIHGGGQFQGCYPPVGPSGPAKQLQNAHLSREEMFHIMEKHQLQEFRRMELESIPRAQQRVGHGGQKMMENPGEPGFPSPNMLGGPHCGNADFFGSRAMMGSPIGGMGVDGDPVMRDMVENLTTNPGINRNLHQQQLLDQKLQEGMVRSKDPHVRTIQFGHAGTGPDGLPFPGQGSFPGGQEEHAQQLDIFGLHQQSPPKMRGTSKLHMITEQKVADLTGCHPSDIGVAVSSPGLPLSHQIKSPSLSQDHPHTMSSPSTPSLKSPNQLGPCPPHPPLQAVSDTSTPTTTSMKSPQVLGPSLGIRSPSASPGHLKSPAMPVNSPRWTSSPSLTSPALTLGAKGVSNGGGNSTETGLSLPPQSSSSTPGSQPLNMVFNSSPDRPASRNPLSLIMSQMSKYAMPSSTPLYHDTIKTIAISDDELPPDRLFMSGANLPGNLGNLPPQMRLSSQGSVGPHSRPQSPSRMIPQGGQGLPFDPSTPMGMPVMMRGEVGPLDGMGPCNLSPMIPPNQMGGFSRMQATLHSPPVIGQQYSLPSQDGLPEHMHLLNKSVSQQRLPHPPDTFPSVVEGPDLSEVIRPTHSGIPEFDLSRIIPADKPSSTLQYFPKSEPGGNHGPARTPSAELLKQLSVSGAPHGSPPSTNPHIANLQNMMAEHQLPPHPGVGVPQQGRPRGLNCGIGPPDHVMVRAGLTTRPLHHQAYQSQGIMSPQQHPHGLSAQQNHIMMQAKARGMTFPGEPFGPQGGLMPSQGSMMGPPHPQSVMMGQQGIRQRGVFLDSPLGYGPGGMANMPF